MPCSIRNLEEIIADPEIEAEYEHLHRLICATSTLFAEQVRAISGVIYFDLVDYGIEGYNKFIPYYLFPDSAYTVSVSTSSFRTKVSVVKSLGTRAFAA